MIAAPDREVPSSPIQLITSPFTRFAKMEAASGIVLLASTIAALVWSNSPWEHSYHTLLETPLTVGFGKFVVTENRHHWINDGLMSLFFFLVGLEIKREFLVGELSSLRRAAFPFLAALGGLIVPAILFLSVARDPQLHRGWAIPISTDIAFTLGLLAVLGRRIPVALRVFVTALAIVDDIFAVAIIAMFYTSQIDYLSLGMAIGGVLVSLVANVLGVRKPTVYAVIGVAVWWAVLNSGVHATIAGILLAFTIPARNFLDKDQFVGQSEWLLARLKEARPGSFEEHSILHTLEKKAEMADSPLHRIEHGLQPWISFLVMPLFALANAGVDVRHNLSAGLTHPVGIGIIVGLFLGKPVGISLLSFAAAKTGLAQPPASVAWRQMFGAACLCGIGFTMSLFVAGLAFDDDGMLSITKIAILAASVLSGAAGAFILATSKASSTADEADNLGHAAKEA
ncbi:Na+/H+ antiporter NhaA [Occallatibacter riparius]|uniref:Na(+)/H(+) antiporter NhaA n=1 Tax=Occallatibacter riparius TaxID=1002689 RepID=A0A9J7BM04_9BACT|nr:Na+/H+ antiporter NhaA [Occallatibacter riparius]UWZ83671.1 Na+/H+ antiporter NhaA [Occallatibacter riparius]